MDIKKSAPLIAAATLGVVAFVAAIQFSSPAQVVDPSQNVKWLEMPVASRNLEPGQMIGEKDLVLIKVDERVMGGAVMNDRATLVGRVTSTMVGKGSLFSSFMLASEGAGAGLAGVLKPGQRAITLEINEFNGMVNFMQPGSRVDLVARVQVEGEQVARTVAQNVLVLAVGPRLSPSQPQEESKLSGDAANDQQKQNSASRSVTLLVLPEQAELFDLASANNFRLTLRASDDDQTPKLAGATMSDLLGDVQLASNRDASQRPAPQRSTSDPFSETGYKRPDSNQKHTPEIVVPVMHKMTVIRAGAPVEIEVEVPAKPKAKGGTIADISDLLRSIAD